ncbi:MAG: hypothetical protein RLZZ401_193, partial [Pseudomonadota bacterium]
MPNSGEASPNPGRRHLVLVGSPASHVQMLHSLAQRRSANLNITLVTPGLHYWHAPRLPDWLYGDARERPIKLALEPLIQRSGAKHVTSAVTALHPGAHQLSLDNGTVLSYDALSVGLGSWHDPQALEAVLPGAATHGLALHPLARFFQLWPQVLELARQRPLHLAVVGGGLGGTELALAMQQALALDPLAQPCRVSLVTGGRPALARFAPAAQAQALAMLRSRHITVLQERCTALAEGELHLANGARLRCDVPVLALQPAPP